MAALRHDEPLAKPLKSRPLRAAAEGLVSAPITVMALDVEDAPIFSDQANGEQIENVHTNGVPLEDQWPDPPVNRDKFYEDLQQFHAKRG